MMSSSYTTAGTHSRDIKIDGYTLEAMALEKELPNLCQQQCQASGGRERPREARLDRQLPLTICRSNVAMALAESAYSQKQKKKKKAFIACATARLS